MKEFNTIALFRLSVLGPLVSRERLERGELQTIIRGLASKEYAIPGSDRRFLGEKTIESWYYAWRAHGIDGLIWRCHARSHVDVKNGALQSIFSFPDGRCVAFDCP
jgi:hypothetical protein